MSTGRTCRELQEYLNQLPGESCYTAFSEEAPSEGNIQLGTRFERKLHGFLSRLTGKQGYWSYFGTRKLIRNIEAEKPDVVVLRNLHSNYIHLPALLTYLAKHDIPTLVVLHDCWFYTGKCCHYTRTGCYKWKSGCGNCPRVKQDNKSWFFDRTAEMWADKKRLFEAIPRLEVVGVSEWITQEARQSFLACAQNISRIYNWIDLGVFRPKGSRRALEQLLPLEGRKMVLGVASGWSDSKGLNHFLKLAEELGSEYAVVLVGGAPSLQQKPENVYFVGATSSVDELADYYSAADVFVTLSLEESFGKVSAEALACGTPVVCFDSTANKELVGEGCGQAVEPGDMLAMQAAIVQTCALGKGHFENACRQYAETNFSKEARIQDYLQVFLRLSGPSKA